MKKRYTITLDPEVVEVVTDHLSMVGMNFSGFINALLASFAQEIKGQPVLPKKSVKQLTLEEFGNLMSYWAAKADEVRDDQVG